MKKQKIQILSLSLIVGIFFLTGCSENTSARKPDPLEQLKKEDLASQGKPIPKNIPAEVPVFPKFTKVIDTGEFGAKNEQESFINPILWLGVENEDELKNALEFYKRELTKTRFKPFDITDASGGTIKNTQITYQKGKEKLTLNFISNYLGSPAVKISYFKNNK